MPQLHAGPTSLTASVLKRFRAAHFSVYPCSLAALHCSLTRFQPARRFWGDARPSHADVEKVLQICQQIAYIFLPVGSAITAMQLHLMAYLEASGAPRPRTACGTAPPVPQPAPLSRQATDVLLHSTLASGHSASDTQASWNSAHPSEVVTTLLPQVMFDYVACLLHIGMKMDGIAHHHSIKELKAVDILKQQVRCASHSCHVSMHMHVAAHSSSLMPTVCCTNMLPVDIQE